MPRLPEDDELYKAAKRNRALKLSPKVHKIAKESGRSTKHLWKHIIEKSKSIK